mmetsp:Transcript_4697/g.10013  ORF Transcript_4697/g.10013 Transcript_4697/m.10013 type:complete len:230 (+) Transcript_4697:1505-2194(+)
MYTSCLLIANSHCLCCSCSILDRRTRMRFRYGRQARNAGFHDTLNGTIFIFISRSPTHSHGSHNVLSILQQDTPRKGCHASLTYSHHGGQLTKFGCLVGFGRIPISKGTGGVLVDYATVGLTQGHVGHHHGRTSVHAFRYQGRSGRVQNDHRDGVESIAFTNANGGTGNGIGVFQTQNGNLLKFLRGGWRCWRCDDRVDTVTSTPAIEGIEVAVQMDSARSSRRHRTCC